VANQYRAKDQTRRCSEREPADSLSDKFNIIGGWLPSLSSFLVVKPSTHRFRKAAFKTLALSIPALLIVCSTVAGWDGPAHAIILWPLQILVGFVCMAAFIWFSARFVAAFCARHFLGLGFYFVLVFLIGAVSGSASSLGLYQ